VKYSTAYIGAAGIGATVLYFLSSGLRRKINTSQAVQAPPKGRAVASERLLDDARSQLIQRHVLDYNLECEICSCIAPILGESKTVDVSVDSGVVSLQGTIRARDKSRLLKTVAGVPGVKRIENHLQVVEVHSISIMGPALTLSLLGVGATGVAWGLSRRGRSGYAAVISGAGLVAAAIVAAQRRGKSAATTEIKKVLHIQAPVERVFDFWSRFENFPRFMPHLSAVKIDEDGLTHWTAKGPAGLTFSWVAQVTKYEHNRRIAWRSVRDSRFENSGSVTFEPEYGNGTRIEINLCFNPPAGAVGLGLARFLGYDPKSVLDHDLLRLKSLIELGKTRTPQGQTISIGQLLPVKE
jgi:uncharacterized membrane protein